MLITMFFSVVKDKVLFLQGKLAASLKWLIIRVYEQEKDVPDKLRGGIIRDDEVRFARFNVHRGCSR